jgi:hypothetical protein
MELNLRTAYAKIQTLEAALANAGGSPSLAVTSAAAAASLEASEARERYTQVRSLLEALGISALEEGGDEKADRLVAALGDLRLMAEERQNLIKCLVELLEAADEFSQVSSAGNPVVASKLAGAMDSAQKTLASTPVTGDTAVARDLAEANVVSVKPELGIVVLDIGSRDGAKPGMPYNLYREDKPIANVVVTEVRRSVSGAVVRDLFSPNDKPQVGDRGEADASNSL